MTLTPLIQPRRIELFAPSGWANVSLADDAHGSTAERTAVNEFEEE